MAVVSRRGVRSPISMDCVLATADDLDGTTDNTQAYDVTNCDRAIIAQINAAEPDYVWVGLGTPKQDLWVAANRPRLRAPALLAVGAAFDVLAGTRRRAPRWMQRSGTEWIYRLAAEPRRLGSRYTRVNARFVRLLIKDRFKRAPRA